MRIDTPKMHGEIELRVIDVKTGKVVKAQFGHNLITYEGSDILGRIAAGETDIRINTMYFEFENGGSSPSVTATREGRSYYESLELTGTQDYMRIPIEISPSTFGSDGNFTSNRVIFNTMTSGTTGAAGLEFSSAALSTVYGLALVAAPDPNDRTDDLVYSRSYDFVPEAKDANHQISVQWPIQFS